MFSGPPINTSGSVDAPLSAQVQNAKTIKDFQTKIIIKISRIIYILNKA